MILIIARIAQHKLIKKVAVGTAAEVLEECDAEWAQVRIGAKEGYMMRKLLKKAAIAGNDEAFNKLMQAQQLISEVVSMLGGAAG